MDKYYKQHRLRELADDDEFILALAEAFLEEVPEDAIELKQAVSDNNHSAAYSVAHKMKPTIEVFELGISSEFLEVLEWGRLAQDHDIKSKLEIVLTAIENASNEIKEDFNL